MSRASLAVPDQISATFDWLSYNPLSYLSRTTFHQLIGDWMDGTLAASMTTLTEGLIQRTLRSENYALPCLSEKQQQVDDWEAGFVKETGERRSGGLSDDINIRRKYKLSSANNYNSHPLTYPPPHLTYLLEEAATMAKVRFEQPNQGRHLSNPNTSPQTLTPSLSCVADCVDLGQGRRAGVQESRLEPPFAPVSGTRIAA